MSILTDLQEIRERALYYKRQASYYKEQVIPPFSVTEGIILTKAEVKAQFESVLPPGKFQYEFLDTHYFIPFFADIQKIIGWDTVDEVVYVPEHVDCDNFGIWMAAMAAIKFGVNPFYPVWDFSGKHLYDFVLDAEGNEHILEPQNDKIWGFSIFIPDVTHTLLGGKIYGF